MNRNLRKSDSDCHPDLEWIAFCYIADEMTASEKSDFETRLENDERAQQAVVAAMQQTQAIYAALSETTLVPTPIVTNSSLATSATGLQIPGILFAAAAALMLMVAGWSWYANQDTIEPISESIFIETNSDSEQLADAWIQTLVAFDDNDWNEEIEEEPLDADLDEESSEDWMFVALTDMEASMEGAE
jgi:hypothetical protein